MSKKPKQSLVSCSCCGALLTSEHPAYESEKAKDRAANIARWREKQLKNWAKTISRDVA